MVEDASMVDLQVKQQTKNSQKILTFVEQRFHSQESGDEVVVAGGTIVTLVNKANKCIRKVEKYLFKSVTITIVLIMINDDP